MNIKRINEDWDRRGQLISDLYKELEQPNAWALQLRTQSDETQNVTIKDVKEKKKCLRGWGLSNKIKPQKKIVDDNEVTFQNVMKIPLVCGLFLGLNPVSGIINNKHKIWFSFKSFLFLYSAIICFFQGFATVLCAIRLFRSKISYSLIAFVSFYGSTFSTTLVFIRIAMKWPGLVQQVIQSELADPVMDKTLKFRCNAACVTVLALAFLEHTLSMVSKFAEIMDCFAYEDLYKSYIIRSYAWLFEWNIPYSLPVAVMVQTVNFSATINWNYSDMFIICISFYLTSRLDQVNRKILSAKGKFVSASFWKEMREDYNRVTQLVSCFDEVLSSVVFISFASNLFFICLQLYNCLGHGIKHGVPVDQCPNFPSGPLGGNERAIYFLFSLIFLILRSLTVSLIAARVHSATLVVAPSLYSVPSSAYCVEVQRFLEQLHGNTVALTGLRFFNVTRGLVLSVAGSIVTYELVLLQFESDELTITETATGPPPP